MMGITWLHFREVVATVAIVCEAVELGLYLSILLPATPALWDPSYFSPDRSLLLVPPGSPAIFPRVIGWHRFNLN